jgi:hypothetical protein
VIQGQDVDMIRKRTISGVPLVDKKFLMKMIKLAGMDFLEFGSPACRPELSDNIKQSKSGMPGICI